MLPPTYLEVISEIVQLLKPFTNSLALHSCVTSNTLLSTSV